MLQVALSPSGGLLSTTKLTTKQGEQMNNEVTITGKIKNVRTFTGSKGTMVTGWFDQREVSAFSNGEADRQVYVCGINIVALDDSTVGEILGVTRAGAEQSDLVTLKGRLVTRFDRRQDVAENARRAPQLQLEVFEVSKN
jgi:hypothetical protein